MPSALSIIDLSMTIQEDMPCFGAYWHPKVEISQLGHHAVENRETRRLVLGTHTGTHMDAPRHFIPGGQTADKIQLEQLVGPASVLDLSGVADKQELGPAELEAALGGHASERMILRYDWDLKALNTNRYYLDHPYLSEAACHWIVESGCRVLAMDTPQPDDPRKGRGTEKDASCHKILLGRGVVIVEYLVNIRALRVPEVELVVAPLKILDSDGAPARCFAIVKQRGTDAAGN